MRPFFSSCALGAAIVVAGANSNLNAQQWLRDAIPSDARVHDFGTVARAAKTEHRFQITNTSQSDIHLRSVRASCGCTTPIIETDWIKPGETGTILARFNTGTFTGQKSATLTVSIDKPFFSELQLNVKGYIRSDVVLFPGEASFGEVPVGEPKVVELNLDYAGRNDWKIEEITSPYDFLSASFDETSRANGRVKYKVTARINADAPIGKITDQLVIHTNDKRLTTVPIRLQVDVLSPVQTSPQYFRLGDVSYGEAISKRLVVKGKTPFKVLSITSEVADIGFTPIVEAKPAHILNITVSPNSSSSRESPGGKVAGAIVLETDLIDETTEVELTYRVKGLEPTKNEPSIQVQAAK